jgi:hypothetical protein
VVDPAALARRPATMIGRAAAHVLEIERPAGQEVAAWSPHPEERTA